MPKLGSWGDGSPWGGYWATAFLSGSLGIGESGHWPQNVDTLDHVFSCTINMESCSSVFPLESTLQHFRWLYLQAETALVTSAKELWFT